jgi:Tol biopolymer transport system component
MEPEWDVNAAMDIFRRDRQSNITVLVTRSIATPFSASPNAGSTLAAITPDGQRAAFTSRATDLVAGVSNSLGDVYVRDLVSNTTFHASSSLTNFPFGYSCTNVALSENGRFVIFVARPMWSDPVLYLRDLDGADPISIATNVSELSTPSVTADGRFVLFQVESNIFRFDTMTGSNELINVAVGDAASSGAARDAVMAPDGNHVVFNSDAPDLTTNGAIGFHLFARDISARTTTLLTLATNGQPSAHHRVPGLFSFDRGFSRIAFDSTAHDLVAGDQNRASDLFVRDLTAHVTALVSRRLEDRPRQTGTAHAFVTPDCISADGRFITFSSYDNDLLPGDTNSWPDVFIRNLWSGEVVTTGFSNNAAVAPAISANGRYVAYLRRSQTSAYQTTGGTVFRFDRQTGSNELVAFTSSSLQPAISPDGNCVAFLSNNVLVVRNMAAATNHVIGQAQPIGGRDTRFSADGTFMFLVSTAPLAPGSGTGIRHLYAWHTVQHALSLLTRDIGISGPFAVSGNSRFVTYYGEGGSSLYRYDLVTGTNSHLRSDSFYYPSLPLGISHDGTSVVYGRASFNTELRLLDVPTDDERLLTIGFGLGGFTAPFVSSSGRFIVYGRRVPLGTDTFRFQSFARDALSNSNVLISSGLQGTAANSHARPVALSADGGTVVIQSAATDLVDGDFNDRMDVFVLQPGLGDSDNDQLDDDWEMAYFSDLSRNGQGDFDADGATDFAEFLAGTDPGNSGSVFRVLAVTSVGSGVRKIIWSGNPARRYAVEFKNDINAVGWTAVNDITVWEGSTASVTDYTANSSPRRYYRARWLP